MSSLDQIIEGFFRLFVVMIPVAAVVLLLVAAHITGGAARPRQGKETQTKAASARRNTSPEQESAVPDEHAQSTGSKAA